MFQKISSGDYEPLPEIYSEGLCGLADDMLNTNPKGRPSMGVVCATAKRLLELSLTQKQEVADAPTPGISSLRGEADRESVPEELATGPTGPTGSTGPSGMGPTHAYSVLAAPVNQRSELAGAHRPGSGTAHPREQPATRRAGEQANDERARERPGDRVNDEWPSEPAVRGTRPHPASDTNEFMRERRSHEIAPSKSGPRANSTGDSQVPAPVAEDAGMETAGMGAVLDSMEALWRLLEVGHFRKGKKGWDFCST